MTTIVEEHLNCPVITLNELPIGSVYKANGVTSIKVSNEQSFNLTEKRLYRFNPTYRCTLVASKLKAYYD